MSLATTRLNLGPVARVLASGVPASPRLPLSLVAPDWPSVSRMEDGDHGHHSASRSSVTPAWASKQSGNLSLTRLNATAFSSRRYLSTTPARPADVRYSATGVPDLSHYRASGNGSSNRTVQYFMVGSLGVLAASGAKSTVTDILSNLGASADVLALAKIEVEMGNIPEGKNLIVKWRGKPVFIRHRTADEIDEANGVDVKSLRDPQSDEERTKRPEWLVMLGVCTHLGCVPIGEAGDFGGWFCPCHGSHYDISGRIRKGPAPLNLEIPQYDFNDDEEKIVVG